MSETYRQLATGKTVILDALNLISGYRYQLWCQAREAGTGFALVSAAPICGCLHAAPHDCTLSHPPVN